MSNSLGAEIKPQKQGKERPEMAWDWRQADQAEATAVVTEQRLWQWGRRGRDGLEGAPGAISAEPRDCLTPRGK